MKWTLEGKVEIESGKLLVIDPCYLSDFDYGGLCQEIDRPLEEAMKQNFQQEIRAHAKIIDRLLKEFDRLKTLTPDQAKHLKKEVVNVDRKSRLRKVRPIKNTPPYALQ